MSAIQGSSFGATSTLVAQMGILLGMLASQQSHTALLVASISSAISGSFGDAFSMYVSESSVKREAFFPALSVLGTKLALGFLYAALFYFFQKPVPLILSATLLALLLLWVLSTSLHEFGLYVSLTGVVVGITAFIGSLLGLH